MEKSTSYDGSKSSLFNENTRVEIIIPTLNEQEAIENLIHSIRSNVLPVKVSILVVDGGSTDRTLDICKRESVRFILQKKNGKGSAIREAVDKSEADIVVFIDGDGTYSIADLKLLLEPLLEDKSDMVVGSRILGKREKGAISMFNAIGNKLFNMAINFGMRTHITDSLSGYRALHKRTFKDLILFSDAFEIEVEMTVEALAKGYRVTEAPVKYSRRKEKSRTKLEPLHDGTKIATTLLFILINANPLKFFGFISLGLFAAGVPFAILVVLEKVYTGDIVHLPSVILSSLLFVASTLSLIVGLISELVVRARRRLEYLINRKLDM